MTLVFHSAEPSPGVFTNFTFGPVKLFSVETLRPSKFGRLYRAALVACAYFSYDGIACAAATARDICHSKYHGVYDIVTGECSVYQRLTSVCLKAHFNPTSQAWELVPGPQQGCTFVAGGWEAATYTAGTLIHVWRGVHGASDASHMWIPVSTSATTSYNIAHGHESVPFEDTTIVLRSEFDPYLVGEQVTETTYECLWLSCFMFHVVMIFLRGGLQAGLRPGRSTDASPRRIHACPRPHAVHQPHAVLLSSARHVQS